FKLAILSDANCLFLEHALKASALRYGIWLQVHIEPMGNTLSAIRDPASAVYEATPDAVLLAYTFRLFNSNNIGDPDCSKLAVNELIQDVIASRDILRERSDAKLIVQTIAQAPQSLLGSLELRTPGTVNSLVSNFNREILATDMLVLDIERLAN